MEPCCECNPIQLNGEKDYLVDLDHVSIPFSFEDLGGNGCGCGEQLAQCAVLSTGLDPPGAMEPPPAE